MKGWRVLFAVAGSLLVAGLGAAEPRPARTVDLTHAFDETTLYWPTEEGFVHEKGAAGTTPGGYHYEAHRFRGAEHGGTHVDAPIHFSAEGLSVDRIPLSDLMGPGVVVDVGPACAADPDYRVGVADFEAFEKRSGRIPEGAIVLIRTGFGLRWPDRKRYLGTARRGPEAVPLLHFPGLDPEAARWLVEERKVRAVGIDTASIDAGTSKRFRSHRILADHQVPVFENVAALEELPVRGFRVIALPMKIAHGSGAPVRIVALVP